MSCWCGPFTSPDPAADSSSSSAAATPPSDVRDAVQARLKIAALNDAEHRHVILSTPPRVWRVLPLGTVYLRTVYVRTALMVPRREYALFVPHAAANKTQQPLPVVWFWHGKGESVREVCLDEQRFMHGDAVVVFPQAHGQPIDTPDPRVVCLWDVCFPFDGDDLDFTDAILTDLHTLCLAPSRPHDRVSTADSEDAATSLHLCINWHQVVSCGFSNGGLWQSVLMLRYSHVFCAIANYQGGLSMSDGSWLPDRAPSAWTRAKHAFEPLDPGSIPPDLAPCRLIPLLIVTGDVDTMQPQCTVAHKAFVEQGHPVEFVCEAGLPHEWRSSWEHAIWRFFQAVFAQQTPAV